MTRVTGRQAALSTERQEKGCFICIVHFIHKDSSMCFIWSPKKKTQLREEKIKVKQDHQ